MKKKLTTKLIILVIFLITLIAYGQTLNMYFWIDDNAMIYKIQHMDQNIGYWGQGVFGQGPYRHIVSQFLPFYPIFKINPMPYYALGILFYFFAGLAVYYVIKKIFGSRIIAFTTAAIFASGYIGSESIFGLVNSWQTSRGIIMSLFTFLFYFKFTKSRKVFNYILALILFYLSLETVYIRAHGLIFALILFDLLFWPFQRRIKSAIGFLLRLSPFVFIHFKIYFTGASSMIRGFGILKLFEEIFSNRRYELLTIPLQDLGNLFIPDRINVVISKMLFKIYPTANGQTILSTAFGILFLAIFLYLIKKYWKKNKLLVKTLIFSVGWIIANFMVFYAKEPEHSLWGTHRYYSYSFVGLALFWAIYFYLVKNKFKLKVFGVIAVYLILGVNYQFEFNKERSIPAKQFFKDFESFMPQIPKGSILFFDLANDGVVKSEYGRFFGGMFTEGSNFAIYSEDIDYMKDFIVTYDFEDILEGLKNETYVLSDIYSFYYGHEGLIENTKKTRELISSGKKVSITNIEEGANTIKLIPPDDTQSLIPSILEFNLQIIPQIPQFPYMLDESVKVDPQKKGKVLNYLMSQSSFRKYSKSFSASFWKEQEAKYATDGRLDTSWRGHRGFWHEISIGRSQEAEYLLVDMGIQKTISRITWVSAQKPLFPIEYKILTSLDGVNYKTVKEVSRKMQIEGTKITDNFDSVSARYVKMEIVGTYGDDGPEIVEFEVIEEKYSLFDDRLIEIIRKNPFVNTLSFDEYNQALSYIKSNATIKVYWMSDADRVQDSIKYVEIPVFVDGKYHWYQIDLPVTGVNWSEFTIELPNLPANSNSVNANLTYPVAQ